MLLRLLPLLLLPALAWGQTWQPTFLTTLEVPLHETSGLLVLDGAVWTHGDSGNPNKLYRVDPANGSILREVLLANTTNVDWEDMTADEQWVYVGDFGNNLGARTDLCIYRFPLEELLDDTVTEVICDTIRFSYADQVDFTPIFQSTNFDCEAFIAKDDSLYLFTKNWGDQRSHLYVLPAVPGDHTALLRDTLESQGMITGAAYDAELEIIALIGFTTSFEPFAWRLSAFTGSDLLGGLCLRADLLMSPQQTEGIAWAGVDSVLITNELSAFGPARLWAMPIGLDVGLARSRAPQLTLYPNPASHQVRLAGPGAPADVRVFNALGAEVMQLRLAPEGSFAVDHLAPGTYTVVVSGYGSPTPSRLTIVR
jgi:hypothetical protein